MEAMDDGAEQFLNCLVSPVKLLCAAIWQLIQQEDILSYGILEEFVSLITETVPDLLSYRQRTELTIGLRAKVVLELCSLEDPDFPDLVQIHLQQIQNLLALHKELEADDSLVEESGTNFVNLVQTLMKDPAERSIFTKDVYPVQYGEKFNTTLKKLMWLFLCRLENALPKPTIEETAHLLSTAPKVLEHCVKSISQPQQLKNVLKYQRTVSVKNKETRLKDLWSTIPDDCILSCLGSHLVIDEQTHMDTQSDLVLNYPPSICQEVQLDSVVFAQYIESDLKNRSPECVVNVGGIECFATGENKEYGLQNIDQVNPESASDLVYNGVESVPFRAFDFILAEGSEKQGALKSEGTVEGTEAVNSGKEACQEENRMAKDCAMEIKAVHPKIELTLGSTDDKSNNISTTTESNFDHISTTAEANSILNDLHQQSKDASKLVTFHMVKQPCIKLDRLDITGKPVPQPWNNQPPKRSRGRPNKDTQKKKDRTVKTVAELCTSTDKPSEIQDFVHRAIQKLKKTYNEAKGSSMVYACTLCTFQDSDEIHLDQHLIANHEEEYKQLCFEDAKEKTAQISAMPPNSENQNKSRSKIRLYRGVPVCKTCPICGKTFTRSSDMRRHQTLHTVPRPFTCLYCGKTFRYTFDLKKHQQHSCPNQKYFVLEQKQMEEVADAGSKALAIISNNENLLPLSPVKQQHVENKRTHQIVCKSEHKQKQCDYCDTIKGNEEAMPDDSVESHVLSSGKLSEEADIELSDASTNSSPDTGTALNSGDQLLQVPVNILESSEASDIETPEPDCSSNLGSKTRRLLRSSSNANTHKCTQCGVGFKYSYNLKKHEDICEGKKQTKVVEQVLSTEHSTHSTIAPNFTCIEESSNSLPDDFLDVTQVPDIAKEVDDPEWQKNEPPATKNLLTCDKCGKKSNDLDSLQKHKKHCVLKVEHYKCVKCGFLFRTLLEVRKHVHTHWGEDPLQCSQCGKYFQTPTELSNHKIVHDKDSRHSCTLCHETFKKVNSLKEHYHDVHDFTGPYKCPHCDKTHEDLGSMLAHTRTHNDERPYQCSQCLKRFKDRSSLNTHEKLHSGDRPFLCEACGKSFSSKFQLKRHAVAHSNERPYTCSQCKKTFKSQHTLRGHSLKHSKPANISCEICGKLFSQLSALDRHLRTHTGERPYSCPKCDKTFLSTGEVTKHLRFHTGERPFKCPRCSKSFTQTCYLTSHMRIHTGERPYTCIFCDKRFVCSTHMKRHMLVHTQEKSFECSCGKAFSRRNLLRVHQDNQCFLQR